MKIWKINSIVDIYTTFFLENENESNILKEILNKGNYIDKWTILNIKIDEENPNRPMSDSLYLWTSSRVILVSEKVKNILSGKFQEYIQFLPVFCKGNGQSYYILNIFDCIDYEKSEFRKLMDKYIIDVKKYILKENINLSPIFKIYLDVIIKGDSYVTNDFKKLIEDNRLKGFEFTEVFEFKN